MALSLSINVTSADCENLILTETTGAYNVTTNPTGWGAPNPTLGVVDTAYITVETPDGSIYSFSVQPNLPSDISTDQFLINYSNIGFSSGLVDGIYEFTYEVTVLIADVPVLYTATLRTMITCNLQCCIDTLLLDIDDWDCDCSDDAKEKFLTAHALYEQIQHSIECGDLTTAENLVDMANKICKNSNCSNCK